MNSMMRIHSLLERARLRRPSLIITVNDFDEDAAAEFIESMSDAQNTGQPVIPVCVDSYGGEVHGLLAMISAIRSSNVPVATIVQGKAMSCGAVLAACGTRGMRYIDPLASIMVHQVSNDMWGKIEEIKTKANETDRLNKLLFSMLDEQSGQEAGYFKELLHKNDHTDLYLTAEDAVRHGLADHIRVPTFVTSIDVKFELK